MIKTAEELELEAVRLQARIREVRQARIDELWPTYYKAQITLARNSMDLLTKVLKQLEECKNVKTIKATIKAEIASLIIFIDELEKENDDQDITI